MVKALIALRLSAWLTALILAMFWLTLLVLSASTVIDVGIYVDGSIYLFSSLFGLVYIVLALRRSEWRLELLLPLSVVLVVFTLAFIISKLSGRGSDPLPGFIPEVMLALLIGPLLVLMHLWLAAYPTLEAKLTKQSTPPHEPPSP